MEKVIQWVCVIAIMLPASVLNAQAPAGVPASQPDAVRQAFLKIIDRPKVDLAPDEQPPEAVGQELEQIHFSYATDARQRVPGLLTKRADSAGRRPVVIILHGTGGKKETEAGLLKQYAAKGFIAVAVDARYHGERVKYGDYNAAIAKAFEQGGEHPLYYDTVWDVMRLIDYLQTRADVDASRVGLMGISKGGIETYLTAAVDPRVTVAVPCIGVQSFTWALEHDAWRPRVATVQKGFSASLKEAGLEKPDAAFVRRFYDHVVPGIYDRFDGPAMMRLIAPRPLLVINGQKDDKTPLDGVLECDEAARDAYGRAGAAEKFKQIIEPNTGHNVTHESADAAMAWFEKWLGG